MCAGTEPAQSAVMQSQAPHHRGPEARKPAPGPDAKEMLTGARDFPFRGLPHLLPELRLTLWGQSVSPGWTSTLSDTVLRTTGLNTSSRSPEDSALQPSSSDRDSAGPCGGRKKCRWQTGNPSPVATRGKRLELWPGALPRSRDYEIPPPDS